MNDGGPSCDHQARATRERTGSPPNQRVKLTVALARRARARRSAPGRLRRHAFAAYAQSLYGRGEVDLLCAMLRP